MNTDRNRIQPEDELPRSLSQQLRALVHQEREATMMSMPTERVMRSIARSRSWSRENVVSLELLNWFRPVAFAGTLAILMLVVYNVRLSSTNELEQSTTEMMLGLPPVTVNTAYHLSIEDH